MTLIERDQWYCVIDCKKCGRGVVLGEAATVDTAKLVAKSSWKCPYCKARQTWQAEQIQSCQGIYI